MLAMAQMLIQAEDRTAVQWERTIIDPRKFGMGKR